MKKLSFYFLSFILVLFIACDNTNLPQEDDDSKLTQTEDSIDSQQTELSGTWKIKSLMANGEEYLYHDHVRDYAPDIAKSAIVFGEDNTFELSFVYMDAPGADEPYAEIHKGTYTLDGNSVEFNTTECTKGGSDIELCKFEGEVDGDLLRISKSFAAGELWIIPIVDQSVAVNVIFKLR